MIADDTAILSVDKQIEEATNKVQAVNTINWTKKWRIKLNDGKSSHKLHKQKSKSTADYIK